ncbi:MAG: nickel-dependent lactate racemase [Candidatus Krumholzibacteria bacterium]|nr:nickel-dependent lactate racemase [Candidatus Krumholzibacteria bacterium]
MEIRVPYGAADAVLRLPPDIAADFARPAQTTPVSDVEGTLLGALDRPIGLSRLDETLSSESRVVVLISDLTRGQGSRTLLPLLVQHLRGLGIAAGAIKVLVARGTHRKLTKEEKALLGSGAMSGVDVEEHDCDDNNKLSALLLTRRATPVRINIALKDVDAIILLAPVSFHYFAGFGGGRKLVLPGAADRASILANHKLSLVDGDPVALHAKCVPGNLDGNPVHEDMCETLAALQAVFAINFFCDTAGNLVFLNAGHPVRSHMAACEAYADIYRWRSEQAYDVMVLSAGGYPCDINLLQAHKALRHAAGVMKQGGAILYFAQCEEGTGSTSLESALKIDKAKFLKVAYKNYDLNNQTALSLHNLTDRFEVRMVSAMNVDTLLSCGIKPCVNTEAFLAEALEKRGTNRLAVVSHGASLLSMVKDGVEP